MPIYFAILFCLLAHPLLAQTPPGTWRMTADRTVASHDRQYVEAFGSVQVERGDDFIKAEYARYYQASRWVYLRGNIEAKLSGDYLRAEEAEFDLATNRGWLKNGTVFLASPHMYFSGELLKRTAKDAYEFREATVTVCDGDRPAWSIATSQGAITLDGYAQLWNPRIQILGQPVAYAPYAIIPVKTKRQSGFLLPETSLSKQLGLVINQPYYQVLDEESDVTLYANLMTEKGLMLGAEYRLTPDIYSKGLLRVDYLYDNQIEGTSPYRDNDGMERVNRHRYWLRGKYDGYLGDPDLGLKIDLDWLSDQDYLRDFGHGYSGFRKSRKAFLEAFGRDIADRDDKKRVNRLLLSRNWAHFGLFGLVEFIQNLEYGSNNDNPGMTKDRNPTLQRLPQLDAYLYQTELGDTPFTLEGEAQLVSFWREYGTTGTRLDLHPTVGLALHEEWFSFLPKLGVRGTFYDIDRFENEPLEVDTRSNTRFRGLWDFSSSLSTELFRVFPLAATSEPGRWQAIRHAVQPRLSYHYIPYRDHESLPFFDRTDRVNATNALRYSITNVFTRKTQGENGAPDFAEIARIKLEQGVEIREARRTEDLDRYPRRPWTDLLLEASTSLTPWLTLTDRTWFSPYAAKVTEHEHVLVAAWPSRGYVLFGLDFLAPMDEFLRQEQERQNIAHLGAGWNFGGGWSTALTYRTDWEAGADLEKTVAVRYRHQCFDIESSWSRTDTDTRLEFRLFLDQLGGIER